MNPNYLSGYIRRHTGQTFKSILQENRLLFAQNLLRNTNLPVTEICARAGYANVSFFYKIFAKRFGCTPAQYRSQGGESEDTFFTFSTCIFRQRGTIEYMET